ncbi:hypothetical protein [Clostridium algidicarnis]|uniref:hypothetical protein n=1 Tax=Clostridium algidicarnis TaxID=37659 RepID=UPI001C0B0813|nr:hypothetical protein [Clostridium algidicarnis]MBU3203731.1 hypothetical protein [Clostridium algidicarnis]MBU3211885.1 hypothetical protein [Clostridium algidicarnis]MBU3221609.1 hypothetical protein [Clostridium algidicarnis]
MYCVIQKIKNKKTNSYGEYKKLEVNITTCTINNMDVESYGYRYGGGRFERTIKDSYKISIHESYREDGKVKKKQWVICTIPYYSIIDYGTWVGDYTVGLGNKLKKIGITEDELCDIVYKKLDPIIESVKKEYEVTEEYKTHLEHQQIIKRYQEDKEAFESIYGNDTYDYCYDVFRVLRNKNKLDDIKAQYESTKEYQRSYHDNYKSNYSDYSDIFKSKKSSFTEEEKKGLKLIYKSAAKGVHPDICKDNGEAMKLLNKLKEEWKI